MASVDECEQALKELAKTVAAAPDNTKGKLADRTLSCYLTDLNVTFTALLQNRELRSISRGNGTDAQIKLAMSSDDLLALTNGSLSMMRAWTSGRVKINASVVDLLALRRLL